MSKLNVGQGGASRVDTTIPAPWDPEREFASPLVRANSKGTCEEVALYIAKQQAQGWPGSISIHGNAVSRRRPAAE